MPTTKRTKKSPKRKTTSSARPRAAEIPMTAVQKFKMSNIGLLMQHWHSSASDPIYAVGSFFFAKKQYPDITVVERARGNLVNDRVNARRKLHGWGPAEVRELTTIIKYLDEYIAKHS